MSPINEKKLSQTKNVKNYGPFGASVAGLLTKVLTKRRTFRIGKKVAKKVSQNKNVESLELPSDGKCGQFCGSVDELPRLP